SCASSRARRMRCAAPPSWRRSRSSASSKPPTRPGVAEKEDLDMRSFVALAVAASAVAAALAAGAGRAAPAGAAWSRISGPTQPGNQLGLARTSDGVLHVVWNRGATPTSIFETRLSPAGQPAGTSTVANGWDGNQGLALLVMPDASLRLFAAGAVRSGSNVYGINTFTASPHGGDWTLQSGSSWGGA